MIQVCSQCGTRWNVRDKQRVWCPRCNGTLLAPTTTTPAATPTRAGTGWSAGPRTAPRLPPGYRWIAVRPGPPPPPRRRRRPLGPDAALRRDTALGPARLHRTRRHRAGPGHAACAVGRPSSHDVLRRPDRAGYGGTGARGALSPAGHQPQHLAELAGGRRGRTAQRFG